MSHKKKWTPCSSPPGSILGLQCKDFENKQNLIYLIVYRRTLIIDIFSSFKIHFIFLAWKILLAKKFSSKVMMKSLTPILKNWLEEQETTFDSLRAMSTATGSLMGIFAVYCKFILKMNYIVLVLVHSTKKRTFRSFLVRWEKVN